MALLDVDKWKYVGVDGCKGGWFCVGYDDSGDYGFAVFCSFRGLLDSVSSAELVLIDIPIGLPEAPGGRECDFAARALLDHPYRKRSVFPTPTRQTVEQAKRDPTNYGAAATVQRSSSGKGLQKQAFAIVPKIAEVDEMMITPNSSANPSVREVHPELCFWALNFKRAMRDSKKTEAGWSQRLRVLTKYHDRAQEICDHAIAGLLRKVVARDDILDALAAAVTARLVCTKPDGCRAAPINPPTDNKGLPMEMVYWLPVKAR